MAGSEARVHDIVIAGGTVAGWLTAVMLASALPGPAFSIRLVDEPEPGPDLDALPGGLAALPAIRAAHAQIGLPEPALVQRAGAGFSLGAELVGWTGSGKRYFRPFAPFGAPLDGVAFHNLWLRMRRAAAAGELEEYSLGAAAARLGRFAFPSADPASVLSTIDYGYHLDGPAYRDLLRMGAERRGVTRIEGRIAGADLRGADGFIEAVRLADGRSVEADFFIDCTGMKAALIEGALETGFEDWSRWLPCDRIASARGDGEPFPYQRIEATDAGWRWRMPLRQGEGSGDVFSSAFASDEADAIAFTSGRRKRFWTRNCVAIGAAGALLDPVAPSALQIVERGVSHFLSLMPFKDDEAGEAEEYDRLMGETVERMRDLVILHYKANRRAGAFWEECRAMRVPEMLAYKMRLFEAKGKVLDLDEETWREGDWASVYLGSGVEPRAYDQLAEAADKATVRDRLAGMRKTIRAAAEAMPAYPAFLAGLGR